MDKSKTYSSVCDFTAPPVSKSIYLSILFSLSSTGSTCVSSMPWRPLKKSLLSSPEKLLLLLHYSGKGRNDWWITYKENCKSPKKHASLFCLIVNSLFRWKLAICTSLHHILEALSYEKRRKKLRHKEKSLSHTTKGMWGTALRQQNIR